MAKTNRTNGSTLHTVFIFSFVFFASASFFTFLFFFHPFCSSFNLLSILSSISFCFHLPSLSVTVYLSLLTYLFIIYFFSSPLPPSCLASIIPFLHCSLSAFLVVVGACLRLSVRAGNFFDQNLPQSQIDNLHPWHQERKQAIQRANFIERKRRLYNSWFY